jgi:hypothetical protein
MMRQNATEADGWRDLPFSWPVIVSPIHAVTFIFSAETPRDKSPSAASHQFRLGLSKSHSDSG